MSETIYKPEESKLVITGTLTAFRCGVDKWDKENEKYKASIRCTVPVEIRQAIREQYFADAKDKYIPDPFKELEKAKDDEEIYFNLKSLYPIPCYRMGQGNRRYEYDEVLEDLGGGLPPLGSEVECAIRLKEGAIYPLAIRFITVNKTNIDDYFS